LQAQTLQTVCPVSDGEVWSAPAGEFDELVVGSPAFEDELEVVDVVLDDPVVVVVVVGALLSPGDCPGGMNGDRGALVT
jgi:hypothetical protein